MDSALNALPLDFVRRLTQLVPESRFTDVINGLTTNRVTTFRANTLKTDATILQKALKKYGITLAPLDWSADAFIVHGTALRTITELPEYKEGKLYVQSLSSMIPPLILDPKPGDKVLDIAAAPGSKTTQMAAMMKNTGEIIANDSSQIRMYRLQANLKMQGASIVRTTKMDGRSIWKTYPEYFDKTLVDVPCSMEGRFNTTDPKSYEDWSLKKVRDLSYLQRLLLRSAISATKPGGIIVYSTCTLAPEENEQVIDWVIGKDRNVVGVEGIDIPNLRSEPAIVSWAGKHLNAEISKTARIYPSTTMEGFYVARLRKLKSSVPRILSERS